MNTRLALALLSALAVPGAYHAEASPRQVNAPVHRAIAAQQQRSAEEQARRDSMRPGLVLISPSPNQVIGKVTRVNQQQGFVVGWLHSRYLNLSGHIITRDAQLRTTAVLTVGNARNNRAAGLRIVSGAPNIGDEIVVVTAAQQAPFGSGTAQTQGQPQAQQPPPPSLRPQWQPQAAQTGQQTHGNLPGQQTQQPQGATTRSTGRADTPDSSQPQLIPARLLRGDAKPEVQTRITVTVE